MIVFTKTALKLAGIVICSQLLVSCDNASDTEIQHTLNLNETNSSLATFSEQALINTTKVYQQIDLLNESIALFLSEPTEENRVALGESWTRSHEALVRSGTQPLSDELSVKHSSSLLYQADAWPIQPGYIDAIDGYPNSGIVNDITVSLSVESLKLQHGFSDADEIILGFHPLEYLIFAKTAIDYQLPEHKQQPVKTKISIAKANDNERTSSAVLTTGFDRPDEDPIYRRRKLIQLLGDTLKESVSAYLASRLEKVPYARFVSEDQQQAARAMANLIEVARSHTSQGFEESNLLLDSVQSHSMYSRTSHLNILQRLNSLSEILNAPTWLSRSLARVDKNIEGELQTTLAQGMLIIENGQLNESDGASLLTIFSALNHQLEDIQVKLLSNND